MRDAQAWVQFFEWAEQARTRELDGCIPVALIAMPSVDGGDKLGVDVDATARIMWACTMRAGSRYRLLARLAYLEGKVGR